MNAARVNDLPDAATVAAMRDEISRLKHELLKRASSGHVSAFQPDLIRSPGSEAARLTRNDALVWKQKVVDVVALLRRVAASHSELREQHEAKLLECSELSKELEVLFLFHRVACPAFS